MNHSRHQSSDGATMETIMTALRACYGSLDAPNFRKVSEILRNGPHRPLIGSLRSSGIEIIDTTDLNNDVSIRLVLNQAGDQVGLALSGVGSYAALLHQDAAERYSWVTRPEDAPTPLAAQVARNVRHAGFWLLERSLVSRTVGMKWYDGSEEVTLWQALFTDSDRIP